MKKAAIILSLLLVLAVSGCNNNNKPAAGSTGADTTTKASKVTQVAFQNDGPEDTTDEAVKYITEKAPLFAKYLKKQMTMPLTFECSVKEATGTTKTGVYIKDDRNMVILSVKPDGSETRVIYTVDKAYQVESATKLIYQYDCGEKSVKNSVSQALMKISIDDAKATSYLSDTGTYDGVEYNCETLSNNGMSVAYYFDKNTDDLVYIVQSNSTTKIDKLENSFNNEALFIIPEGYERKSFDELQEKYREERAIEESKYKESIAAESAAQEAGAADADTTTPAQ